MLLDLAAGVVRPLTWAARLLPALVVLGLVAVSVALESPLALRLRVALQESLGAGLLLLGFLPGRRSVSTRCQQARCGTRWWPRPWGSRMVLPAAAVLMPMIAEREGGRLLPLLASPLGARAFAEKFAVSSLLVVLSWSQVSLLTPVGTAPWWFCFFGHALALLSAPAWFFLAARGWAAFGLTVAAPLLLAATPLALRSAATVPVLAGYGLLMLGLVPWLLRRGVARGAPGWLRQEAPGLGQLERWLGPMWGAQLRSQRDVALLMLAAAVGFGVLQLAGGKEGAAPLLFFFSAFGAVLSPALAFAGARQQGSLEVQLAAQPRARVFRRLTLASALGTLTFCGLLPGALLLAASESSLPGLAAWLLALAVLWAVGMAASVHLESTEVALAAGLLVAGLVVVLEGGFFGSAAYGMAQVLGPREWPTVGLFLSAALVVAAAAALFVAWRRFVSGDRLQPRLLAGAVGVSLLHAVVLGGASVVAIAVER